MDNFEINLPTRIIIGPGKINEAGTICKSLGTKAFVLYDPFLKNSDTIKSILTDLKSNNISYIEFNDVVPNPRSTTIDYGAKLCKQEGCDVVIGIGGGSAIDSAKAIALVNTNGGTCWEYTKRQNEKVTKPQNKASPMIVVPTTAGTGTEATPCSVINNSSLRSKCTIIDPMIFPCVSIVDPELMVSVPPLMTALTGIDAFGHAFEAYIGNSANEFSDMVALKSIEMFVRSIRRVVKDGTNIDARMEMALACTLGGWALTMAGVTIPHALGQPLSAFADAPHGGTLAACIPVVIEWTVPYAQEKFAKVATLFDPEVAKLSQEEQAAALPKLIRELYKDIDVNVSFSSYGLKEEDVSEYVDLAYTAFKQDIDNHPKPATREDIEDLVRRCM